MKVFISWSGDLSRAVADTLHEFLPCMINGLDVFMSKHDLESGSRWALELANELDESNYGIICLAPDNLISPWILFEAGALTKHIDGRVCSLLLAGLTPTDVTGPLSQFQNRIFNQEEFKKLFQDINSKIPKPLEHGRLNTVFEKWWPDIEAKYKEISTKSTTKGIEKHKRTASELLEEILNRVRGIETSIARQTKPNFPLASIDQLRMLIDESCDFRPSKSKSYNSGLTLLEKLKNHPNASDGIPISSLPYSETEIKSLLRRGCISIEDDKVHITNQA